MAEHCSIEDARKLSGMCRWRADYLNLNEQGEVVVNLPGQGSSLVVSLKKLVEGYRLGALPMREKGTRERTSSATSNMTPRTSRTVSASLPNKPLRAVTLHPPSAGRCDRLPELAPRI